MHEFRAIRFYWLESTIATQKLMRNQKEMLWENKQYKKMLVFWENVETLKKNICSGLNLFFFPMLKFQIHSMEKEFFF